MSRLMILGASAAQVPAIKLAAKLGHHVIVVDRDPAAPGVQFAHQFIKASTFDRDAVLKAARESQPEGLLVVATDQPVLVAAEVAERLGIGYPLDLQTARLATNKKAMKSRLLEARLPTPAFISVDRAADPSGLDLSQAPLPCVVKPTDNQGQRGVSLVETRAGIPPAIAWARKFSRNTEVLIEEYYRSTEVTVSGWVTGGVAEILAVTDRVTIDDEASLGVCAAHRFPSTSAAGHLDEIARLSARVVAAFGIRRGPIYLQMFVGDRGVEVNEVACRVGGAFEDQSLPTVTGVDVLERAIAESLGEEVSPTPGHSVVTRGVFIVALLYCKPGTVGTLADLSDARRVPGVIAAEWLQPVGRTFTVMRDSSQRVGYAVIHGPERETANQSVRSLFGHLKVTDRNGSSLLMQTMGHCLFPD